MSERNDELSPEVLEALALALPSAGTPPAKLRSQLFDRIGGVDRFLPFLDRMMEIFDLPEHNAQEQLRSIDGGDDWEDLTQGVRYRDFEGGPGVGEAHGGLVRVQTGGTFPMHQHVGEEKVIVLQGRVEDDAGNSYRAGDVIVSPDGSSHALKVVGDQEVIYAALVVAIQFEASDDDDWDD